MIQNPLELQERHGAALLGETNLDSVWAEFMQKYPTSQECTVALVKGSYGDEAIECSFCESDDVEWLPGGRVIKCNRCRKKMWLTAKTFFERSKHHRAWLGGIWLREHGISVSASKFQRLVGDISYSSALAIHKKLAMVLHSQMHENFVSVPSVDFRKAVCRRSRQTLAGQSPADEAVAPTEELQQKSAEFDNFLPSTDSSCNIEKNLAHNLENDLSSLFPGEETSEAENEILGILSAEPLSIDSLLQRAKLPIDQCLSIMTMLELKGLAINVGKNRYTGVLQQKLKAATTCALGASANLQTLISAALDFIKSKFHGISHKYLQYYLAEYWCHIDRDRWLPGSLLRACHESDRVTYKDLIAYESPSELKIWARHCDTAAARPN